jgi:hypothetical protein
MVPKDINDVFLNFMVHFKSAAMKKYLLIAIFTGLVISCKNDKTEPPTSDESPKHADTEIYLSVPEGASPALSLKDRIQFSDNRGESVSLPGHSKYYTSIVNPNKKVTWKQGPNSVLDIDIIEVDMKEMTGNTQVLKQKKYNKTSEGLSAKVKTRDEVDDLSNEYYKIIVVIEGDTITIDPVLQFHD